MARSAHEVHVEARRTDEDASLVVAYLTLRKLVGFIGLGLPVILAAGSLILGRELEPSISSYYGTPMRDEFVGLLVAAGVFFFSYKGYDKDHVAGKIASVCAIGVALFPATEDATRHAHVAFAGALFLTLAYFSLVLFTRSGDAPRTPRKDERNKVYVACGVVMLVGIVGVGLCMNLLSEGTLNSGKPVFWLEWLTLWAFGISWMTKGEAILADETAG